MDEKKRSSCTQRGVKKSCIQCIMRSGREERSREDGRRAGSSQAIKKSLNIFY